MPGVGAVIPKGRSNLPLCTGAARSDYGGFSRGERRLDPRKDVVDHHRGEPGASLIHALGVADRRRAHRGSADDVQGDRTKQSRGLALHPALPPSRRSELLDVAPCGSRHRCDELAQRIVVERGVEQRTLVRVGGSLQGQQSVS